MHAALVSAAKKRNAELARDKFSHPERQDEDFARARFRSWAQEPPPDLHGAGQLRV